jgi:hypothetical protein
MRRAREGDRFGENIHTADAGDVFEARDGVDANSAERAGDDAKFHIK